MKKEELDTLIDERISLKLPQKETTDKTDIAGHLRSCPNCKAAITDIATSSLLSKYDLSDLEIEEEENEDDEED